MKRLLVIDDSSVTLSVIKRTLRAEFDIVTAFRPETAVDVARKEHPDVILLDCVMEPVDGHEVLKALKRDPICRSIPVVMMSIFEGEALRAAQEVPEGAASFIRKPLRPDAVKLLHDLAGG